MGREAELRLKGAAREAQPGRPSRVLQALRGDHANARRLLALMQRRRAGLSNGGIEDARSLVDMLDYTTGYADRVHHPREDRLFECLIRRVPELSPVADDVLAEHRELADAGADLIQLLDRVVGGESVLVGPACRAVDAYIDRYRRHMEREEGELFEAAGRVLEAADWVAVEAAAADREDPLFGRVLETRFQDLYAELMRLEAGRND